MPAEIVGFFDADAVKIEHPFGFIREVDRLRGGQLHAGGQFVCLGASRDIGVERIVPAKFLIQLEQRLHLPVALGCGAALGGFEIRDRRIAWLTRGGGDGRAQVAARQLYRR